MHTGRCTPFPWLLLLGKTSSRAATRVAADVATHQRGIAVSCGVRLDHPERACQECPLMAESRLRAAQAQGRLYGVLPTFAPPVPTAHCGSVVAPRPPPTSDRCRLVSRRPSNAVRTHPHGRERKFAARPGSSQSAPDCCSGATFAAAPPNLKSRCPGCRLAAALGHVLTLAGGSRIPASD
jgi:hypothetical protein